MAAKTFPLWISHSSMRDYLACPRAYYLHQIYKDPVTRHKITTVSPSLALGQIVHEVLESLALIRSEDRFNEPLIPKFERAWEKISGELGGFKSHEEEEEYKIRGLKMIQRVVNNPGPLVNKTLRLKSPDPKFDLPRFNLSIEEDIILCGKLDWMEYVPEDDSVHIMDFKTGKHEEDDDSLQLPIYCLLAKNCQRRAISKTSYWYLENSDVHDEKPMPNLEKSEEKILEIGKMIKEARLVGKFTCPRNGCFTCRDLEAIVNKKAKYVGSNSYQDIYVV